MENVFRNMESDAGPASRFGLAEYVLFSQKPTNRISGSGF